MKQRQDCQITVFAADPPAGEQIDSVGHEVVMSENRAFRAARRRQNKESSTVPMRVEVEAPQILEEEPEDKYADLRVAFASLPLRQRQAVSLRVLEGLSVRKAAAEMSISPQAVSRYYERGVSSLRNMLSERIPDRAGAVAS